jgi:CheY-like chemotaxis protein
MARPLTVLFAEDDEGHATLVKRNLARSAVAAHAVHLRDGQELLDYIHRRGEWKTRGAHDQIAILLDLNMPRVGGLDVLRQLKEDTRYSHIPVFVLTTTDNPVELDRCYKRGASACMVKPVDYGSFGDMIRRLAEFLGSAKMPPETPINPPHVH